MYNSMKPSAAHDSIIVSDAKVVCIQKKNHKSATDLLKQKNEEFMAQKRAIMKQKKLDAVKALDEKIKQQALKKAANGEISPKNDKLIISGGPPSGSPSIFAKLGAGRGPRPGPNTPEAAKLKAARILQAQKQPKNAKTEKEKILERVKQNRMTKQEKKAEENKESEFMGKKMTKTDAKGKSPNLKSTQKAQNSNFIFSNFRKEISLP